jgi:hypothetical protein
MSTRRTNSPSGSLTEHVPDFPGYLFELGYLGYSASVANKHLQLLADLSHWREREGISTGELAAVSTEGLSAIGAHRAGRTGVHPPRWTRCRASLRQLGVIETRSSAQRVSMTAEFSGGRYRPPEDLLAFLGALGLCRLSHRQHSPNQPRRHRHDGLSA